MKYKRIIVKFGSNVLSRPDGTLDVTRMSALVDQVAQLHCAGVEIILVSSGAVASGRGELRLPSGMGKLDTVSARQLYSAVGQAKLINRYYDMFREWDIRCGQVLTTKESLSTRTHYLNQKNCMGVMLRCGVIPIMNENDTISVTELMFTDNDELSGMVATMMDAEALILLSNVDGIYNGNPKDPGTHVIREIHCNDKGISEHIDPTRSQFGRGGMLTKSRIAGKVAAEGIEVIIANGKKDGILTGLVLGEKDVLCTRFVPSPKCIPAVKKWIAHSDGFAKGEVHINQGAYEALLQPKAVSLLPVGVTKIIGEFEKDDIVLVISPAGKQIGVGRISADSDKARAAIGNKGGRALIHYDYLYLDTPNNQ